MGLASIAQDIRFIQNKGQWNPQVLFKADIPGGDLYITQTGLVYNLIDEAALHEVQHNKANGIVKGQAIFVDFLNAQATCKAVGQNSYQTKYNYYLGNDKSKWASGVSAFKRVYIKNVYPQIDFVVEGYNGGIKTAFLVHGLGNLADIKLKYRGANNLAIVNGELVTQHSFGEFKEEAPVSFIQHNSWKKTVASSFLLDENTLSYQVDLGKGLSYQDTLVIDPTLIFSTFSGSVADNFGYTATFDKDSNAYGGGTVFAVGFPTTAGAYQMSFAGGSIADGIGSRDAGILKFSAKGDSLLYATYLGGSGNEQPHSMSCDASGNLYILGSTTSINFPVKNAFDSTQNGGYDIFIAKLNANGNTLLASTYFGGEINDGINSHQEGDGSNQLQYNYGDDFRGDIRIDNSGRVYIASVTASFDVPMVNATQTEIGGNTDGLVAIFNSSLSTLIFSTFIGGSNADAAYGLRVNGLNLYVTGGTLSSNLPRQSTNGTFLYHGGVDGFLSRFVLASTITNPINLYIGTAQYDQSYFVSTDKQNRIYLTGQTTGDFVRVGNTFYQTGGRQFITVLNPNLNSIDLQTVFGAGEPFPRMSPSAFTVDICGRVYLSGWGGSSNRSHNKNTAFMGNMPLTADAFQRTTDGSDFYLIVFNKNLISVGYATYFGGNITQEHVDGGTSQFDERGIVYQSVCAGCGGFSDFPTTPGAHSRTNNGKRPFNPNMGGCNNAVFKFNIFPTPKAPAMRDTLLHIFATDTLDYTFDVTDANMDSIQVVSATGSVTTQPGYNFSSLKTMLSQEGYLRVNFKWPSSCANANDTLVLTIGLVDNSCPDQQSSTGTIKIVVDPAPTSLINVSCVKRSGQTDASIEWNLIKPSLGKYLKDVIIYRSENGTGYDSITTIAANAPRIYIDKNLTNAETNNYCYRLKTTNTCNVRSVFSRTSCTLTIDSAERSVFYFSRDTFLYVNAADTLNTTFIAKDSIEFDSVFISYDGELLKSAQAKIGFLNGLGSASLFITYAPLCTDVGDTLSLFFKVQDNKCPWPNVDSGMIYIVVRPSTPANSNPLNCLKSLDKSQIGVSWVKQNKHSHLKYFTLIKRDKNGIFSKIESYPFEYTTSIIENVINPLVDSTCYALVAFNRCDLPTDTGQFSCVPWADEQYPAPKPLHYVTVVDNSHIELSWAGDTIKSKQLYRYSPFTNTKEFLANLSSSVSDSVFTDRDVQVDKNSYCYFIESINDCGLRTKQIKHACSILLNGITEPFAHTLTWTTYDYFEQGTEKHELFKRDLNQATFDVTASKKNKVGYHIDETLNKETGIFYYYIKATENEPYAYQAQSNMVELKQAPLLRVPNAFSPNADGTNDTWNIVPVFVKDYHLKVYDRWGKLVFETIDKHKQLSNKDLNSELIALDAFVYVINYTGFEGTVKQVTGNVTILK